MRKIILIKVNKNNTLEKHETKNVETENVETNFFSKKFPIINIRLSNIYGPTIHERPDLLLSIFRQILKGKKTISIWNKKPIRANQAAVDPFILIWKLFKRFY